MWCCWHQDAYWRRSSAYAFAGQAGVTGQEPSQGKPFWLGELCSTVATAVDVDVVAIGHLPGRAEAREGWARCGPSDDASPHRQTSRMITQADRNDLDRRPGSPTRHAGRWPDRCEIPPADSPVPGTCQTARRSLSPAVPDGRRGVSQDGSYRRVRRPWGGLWGGQLVVATRRVSGVVPVPNGGSLAAAASRGRVGGQRLARERGVPARASEH